MLTEGNPFPHFYAEHDQHILEIRAAPIQPSDDTTRSTPPKGWLMVSRLWNQEHLNALGSLTESTLTLDHAGQPTNLSSPQSKLTLIRPLNDWQGQTIGLLKVTREMPAIAQRLRTDVFEARVFIVFGLLVMGSLGLCLHNWVFKPLSAIGDSLDKQNPSALRSLVNQNNELSRIARRLEISFAQQLELRREVEERATRPMEKLLWEIPGVEYIYSTSREGECRLHTSRRSSRHQNWTGLRLCFLPDRHLLSPRRMKYRTSE